MYQLQWMSECKVIEKKTEKDKYETGCRNLWRQCFGDPVTYEEFYFRQIYPYNRVYEWDDKGMIHLNPRRCNVTGKEYVLHYIVGVATKAEERRKGIMRNLLCRALTDMYQNKEPFTYLMPAKEKYYLPFGFCSVSGKNETSLKNDGMISANTMRYMTYQEMKNEPDEVRIQLYERINQWLKQQYEVFAVHDEAYFDLLYKEKACQKGDVIFCFEETRNPSSLCGVFAYAMNQEIPCVEQIVTDCNRVKNSKAIVQHIIRLYFQNQKSIRIAYEYPYMIRIVHMESFLNLFAHCFVHKLEQADGIIVTDDILIDNNGVYCFSKEEKHISVYKCKAKKEQTYIPMTVAQITELVFGEKDTVYFAEIV